MVFKIRLRSFSDFKKYSVFLEKFSFCGFIKADNYIFDARDILLIFDKCQNSTCVQLKLTIWLLEDTSAIKKYIISSGLLNKCVGVQ